MAVVIAINHHVFDGDERQVQLLGIFNSEDDAIDTIMDELPLRSAGSDEYYLETMVRGQERTMYRKDIIQEIRYKGLFTIDNNRTNTTYQILWN